MKLDVLLGLQWGDEGKGKIVDVFTRRYSIIARFQGGPNAGHTLIFDNEKYVLHTIPSGIFHEDTLNVIGNGVVIEPLIFIKELNKLSGKISDFNKLLFISRKAHLILPSHRLLDAAYEFSKGSNKIGSTLKGIGPTYTDKVARNGLRVGDVELDSFSDRYFALKSNHIQIVENLGFDYSKHLIEGLDFDTYEKMWLEAAESLKKLNLVDSEIMINSAMKNNKSVLAEGAQGTMLDIDFGTYPFVTSSNTVSSGVCSGLGIAPNKIGNIFGVFKAYCTRVGSGPFPTELFDETGAFLRKQGAEFGSTTGRPRRCGWLDLPALKYACMLNGVTSLVMMKTDVLSGLDTIQAAVSYKYKNSEIDYLPYDISSNDLQVIYKPFKGWKEDLTLVTQAEMLPNALIDYMKFIEDYLEIPIVVVSIGPDRKQTIFLRDFNSIFK